MAHRRLTHSRRGYRRHSLLVGAVLLGVAWITVPVQALAATDVQTLSVPGVELSPASSGVHFGVDDFVFESYDADFFLDRDSDGRSMLRTVETFVAVFPANQNRGLSRAIPNYYQGVPVEVSNISVTDETGAPRPFESEIDDGFTVVTSAADAFVEEAQTYVFSYEQSNVTRYFATTDAEEWYWDTNGLGWDQPFSQVTATVHLGEGLTGALVDEPRCYWGAEGSRDSCEISAVESGEFIAMQSGLGPRQNVTLALGFEPGTFTARDSSYFSTPAGFGQLLAGITTLAALVWALALRRTKLADAAGRPTIIAEYTPPHDVPVVTSALLLGKRSKAIAAQILDFAVRGKLRILESETKRFLSSSTKYRLELIDPTDLRGAELDILRALFGKPLNHGAIRDLAKVNAKLSQRLYKIIVKENSALVTTGYRRKVAVSSYLPLVLSIVAAFVALLFGIFLITDRYGLAIPFVVGGFASVAAIATVVLLVRSPVTARGAETRDHLEGLKLYIRLAEADRLRMLQSPEGALRERNESTGETDVLKIYEKLLPYAVLFGLEKQWSEELGRYYSEQPPEWYAGSGAFNGAVFATSISSLSGSIASSYSGSSSSSSSGGSGGGGFSGGGGGGGGGGGV